MKKIAVACFCVNETNCGDRLYVEPLRRILEASADDFEVVYCDLYARKPVHSSSSDQKLPAVSQPSNRSASENKIISNGSSRIKSLLKRFIPDRVLIKQKDIIKKKRKYCRIKEYYSACLEGASYLIVPGGGLVEFSLWRDYHILLGMLISLCQKKKVPVYINSIGCIFNERSKKLQKKWKKILTNPIIRDFSCRDHLDYFKRIRSDAKQIPCLASLSADYCGVSKSPQSNTIGLCLIRYGAFSDYGNHTVTKDFLIKYYIDIIRILCEKGFGVTLFTTGVIMDDFFCQELLGHLSDYPVSLLPRTSAPEILLKQISAFRGVLTVRTHAAYASFSLNIPAMMFYFGKGGWEGKANEFMKMVGCPQYAVCCDSLMPDELVAKFEKAIAVGWDQERRKKVKELANNNIIRIIQEMKQ